MTPTPATSRPSREVITGRYTRLEPLTLTHLDDLWAAASGEGAAARFTYLFDTPPDDRAMLANWIEAQTRLDDPLFLAVIDAATGRALGRQALMRITPEHGVIELGSIFWGRDMARTRIATEALYLTARHVFEDLGYRRFEWKCDSRNQPSRDAARRFGFSFEGIFRQHMIVKGQSRDTAWFAMLDADWPALKAEYDRWLAPANFDSAGVQLSPLQIASKNSS